MSYTIITDVCNLLPKVDHAKQVILFSFLLDYLVKEREDLPLFMKPILRQKLKEFTPFITTPEKYSHLFDTFINNVDPKSNQS